MSFLCELVSLDGVFQGLPGMFVCGLVVFFAVMRRGDTVCVCGEIVELCSSLMRVFWHILVSRTTDLILACDSSFQNSFLQTMHLPRSSASHPKSARP